MQNLVARLILAGFLWVGAALPGEAPAQSFVPNQAPLPANEAFQIRVEPQPDGGLRLNWSIAAGAYLYRDRLALTDAQGKPVRMTTEPGVVKDDPTFGETEIYHEKAEAQVAASDLRDTGELQIVYQGCAEQGVCYPPVKKTIDVALLRQEAAAHPRALPSATPPRASVASPLLSGNLFSISLTFIGFGLLLSLTPCVFPMIPILSGMLAGSGKSVSPRRGFVLSTAYVLAMALAYATLGIGAAWSGQNLQVALQTPAALGLTSLIFMALALSMFGLFDLALPQALTQRLSNIKGGQTGSIGGAALLGFGSALIVGPCATPPLAAALLFIARTGDVLRGALALFSLGLGMGLPLILFGAFGSRLLPKSGQWLALVKQGFGFVFLGLAIWVLNRMISPMVETMLWGALAMAFGLWLGGYDLALWRRRAGWNRAPQIFGAGAMVFGLALIAAPAIGALRPQGALEALRDETADEGFVRTVSTASDFEKALASAQPLGQPILVDFTASWCAVCKEIDATILRDPRIKARLKTVSVIRADLSAYTAESQALMRRFDIVGPPTMLFVNATSGREIEDGRTIGSVSVETFLRQLDRAGA